MDACLGPVKVFLCFLLTECRAIVIFYFSLKAVVERLPEWFYIHVKLSVEDEVLLRNLDGSSQTTIELMGLGGFLECVTKEFAKMTMSFNPDPEVACVGEHARFDGLAVRVASIMNYIGLSIVLLFVTLLLVVLAWHHPSNYGSGRFMAFTIHLRRLKAYKFA
eukprot:CAMPEP_0197628336 /NCGR_PEP_ID=MMETSP1338-20131121/6684_1 /TAXON_ID=43686 ORGANISM="Pelagodinium beii, Strain RCC1491" /NCGR_SAMPLE_ID=MMETSP1338 /ASSEMBLY_ACC=CAM_ASM_000754 /LENGTH=162 /DNA_ID=CAMNT_0043199297 /DNA_START=40 /DNA_END=524 /DNA_ORIENTATION=-